MFNLRIISPKEDLFDGPVESISSRNSSGKFDILTGHANFITLILNEEIIVRKTPQDILKFNFPLALVHASGQEVNIYTNIGNFRLE